MRHGLNEGVRGAISQCMRRSFSTPDFLALVPGLRPGGPVALRRAAGFTLLGCSLWLVSMLALIRAVMGLFH
jgi:hypothetical protein